MLQERIDLFRTTRKLNRQHIRTVQHHFPAFYGIVIHEDEAVQSQVKLLGQFPEIGRFGLPVNLPAYKMLFLQRHILMRVKYFPDVSFVVLAAKGQQHALLTARDHLLLELKVRPHTRCPGFPAYALPQRVVAIQNDNLEIRLSP
ncbi:hypothetical protein D3C73_802220 [compost metagenome]